MSLGALDRTGEARAELAGLSREYPENQDVALERAVLALREKRYREAEMAFAAVRLQAGSDFRRRSALLRLLHSRTTQTALSMCFSRKYGGVLAWNSYE